MNHCWIWKSADLQHSASLTCTSCGKNETLDKAWQCAFISFNVNNEHASDCSVCGTCRCMSVCSKKHFAPLSSSICAMKAGLRVHTTHMTQLSSSDNARQQCWSVPRRAKNIPSNDPYLQCTFIKSWPWLRGSLRFADLFFLYKVFFKCKH